MWIATYRTCSHWPECHCHGLQAAAGLSSFIVYKLTGISYFQVVGTNSSSGNVGHMDQKVHGSNPDMSKAVFFQGTWQAHAFLFASSEWYWCALPRRNSFGSFIKLMKLHSTASWVSPRHWGWTNEAIIHPYIRIYTDTYLVHIITYVYKPIQIKTNE